MTWGQYLYDLKKYLIIIILHCLNRGKISNYNMNEIGAIRATMNMLKTTFHSSKEIVMNHQ